MDSVTSNDSGISGAPALAPRARKRPRFFLLTALLLYYVCIPALFVPSSAFLDYKDFWPFLLMYGVFVALWYWLHVIRLRDAGRSIAPALGVLAIYLLSVGLLHLIGAFFMDEPGEADTQQSTMLVRQIFTFVRGFSDPLTYLGLLACLALLVPPVFSIWAALQPKRTP